MSARLTFRRHPERDGTPNKALGLAAGNTQNRGDDGVVPSSPRFCRSVCHSSLGGVSLVRRAALMPPAVIVKTPTIYRA